jgi:hypothetical protein
MFQVNRSKNRLKKLEEKRFADPNLREREHLQADGLINLRRSRLINLLKTKGI